MPRNDFRTSLRTEASKMAKLGNLQAGIPPVLRVLPVIAIAAGEAVSRVTNQSNKVEDMLLGQDEAFLLQPPSNTNMPSRITHGQSRYGIAMCGICDSTGRMSLAMPGDNRDVPRDNGYLTRPLITQNYFTKTIQQGNTRKDRRLT